MKPIKIKLSNGKNVYLNPAFITAIMPAGDAQTRVHFFASTGFVASNVTDVLTPESADSIVARIKAL